MSNDNILFSFYKYIKYKVNSFISNAFYSSRKNFQALPSVANMTNEHPKKHNNYIKYLISQKIQEIKTNNHIYPPPLAMSNSSMTYQNYFQGNNSYNSFFLNDNSNISTSCSVLPDSHSDKNQINLKEENENTNSECDNKYISNNNNFKKYEKKQDDNNKNNYNNNKNIRLIGQKTKRNFFNDEDEKKDDNSIEQLRHDDKSTCEENSVNILTESKRYKEKKFKKKSIDRIKNDIINKRKKNEIEIKRLKIEYNNYKEKLKQKGKINNLFKEKLNLSRKNSISDIDTVCSEKNIEKENFNKTNRLFSNLKFTHPQRFTYYSTNKKRKYSEDYSDFSISVENNINIISPLPKKKTNNTENNVDLKNKKEEINDKNINIETNNTLSDEFKITSNEISNNVKNNDNFEKNIVTEANNTSYSCQNLSQSNNFSNNKNYNFKNLIDNNINSNNYNINNFSNNANNYISNNNIISNINNNPILTYVNSNNSYIPTSMDIDEELKYKKFDIQNNNFTYNNNIFMNNNNRNNPFLIEKEKFNTIPNNLFCGIKNNDNNPFLRPNVNSNIFSNGQNNSNFLNKNEKYQNNNFKINDTITFTKPGNISLFNSNVLSNSYGKNKTINDFFKKENNNIIGFNSMLYGTRGNNLINNNGCNNFFLQSNNNDKNNCLNIKFSLGKK